MKIVSKQPANTDREMYIRGTTSVDRQIWALLTCYYSTNIQSGASLTEQTMLCALLNNKHIYTHRLQLYSAEVTNTICQYINRHQ